MSLLMRIAHALRPATRPPLGAIAPPSREDFLRSYPADGLTPQRLRAILRDADAGDLEEQLALYEQMEEKDAHLYSIAQTRRLAVTGQPWRIVSAAATEPGFRGSRGAADEAAAYCHEVLAGLADFEAVLAHLSLGIGRNIAVAELIWQADGGGVRLAAIEPVAFSRIRAGDHGELRLLIDASSHAGTEPPADKFIVHRPHGPGHAARGGLLRVTAMAFLAKHYAIKDWLIFMEVFGMPVRIARYAPDATPEEKRELLEMLKRLGTDAAGVFSKAVDLEIKQTRVPGDVAPYESICNFFNRELSKAWLGQTLTTDTARSLNTARAAADVHDRVRRDLRDHDIAREAETIRRDLLRPLTRLRFGDDAAAPYFRRSTDERASAAELAQTLAVAVNELGVRVPAEWAHEALGIPESGDGAAVLPGRSST